MLRIAALIFKNEEPTFVGLTKTTSSYKRRDCFFSDRESPPASNCFHMIRTFPYQEGETLSYDFHLQARICC